MIVNARLELRALAENTLSQTADYNSTVLVNILRSMLLTSQKAITIDVSGRQVHSKQIIFYRGDTAEIYGEGAVATEAQVNYHYAWKFAGVLVDSFNRRFGRAPLEAMQLTGVAICEKDENGNWSERSVDLVTLRHPDSAKVSLLRRSAFYYRSMAKMIVEGFAEVIDRHRRQT